MKVGVAAACDDSTTGAGGISTAEANGLADFMLLPVTTADCAPPRE